MAGLDVGRLQDFSTVLCIGAHCDDIEIGCGGAIAKFAMARPQARFVWAVFAGDSVREAETRTAALRLFGNGSNVDVRVLMFRASYFPSQQQGIKDAFEALKQELDPDLILTHRLDDRHQDHALLANLTWNTFRSHLILEYEIPKYEGDLGHPNFFVPLTSAQVDRKIDTLMQSYPSQLAHSWFTAETFRGLARLRGIECAAPGGFAEAFQVRKICF